MRSLKKDRIRKKKLHGAGNRLETGLKLHKDYNLPEKRRNDGLPDKLAKLLKLLKRKLLGRADSWASWANR